MKLYRFLTLALVQCFFVFTCSWGQSVNCPPNIDFEQGNLNIWKFYIGTCCAINTPTATAPINNRHTLTSGTAVDPYGNFPIVAPGSGSYSLKLGNNSVNSEAEKARYYVHVPANLSNYYLIYRYAVVFQDPNHTPAQQPRFEVSAFDSATNALVPCAQYTYVASSALPGFTLSTVGTQVWYKGWTTASLNLSNYGGKTVAVDFASGDCSLGAHFGYGYVDMSCGLFQVSTVACSGTPTVSLSAPPGFQSYQWLDSATHALVDTGQSVTINTPAVTTTYAVVLTPFTGFGCPDTLYTKVFIPTLTLNPTNDTVICNSSSLQLSTGAQSNSLPLTYSWTPNPTLSCNNCANPVASPGTTNNTYRFTVTNASGCSLSDSINVNVSPIFNISKQDVPCFGGNNGSATVTVLSSTANISYQWNTTPAQTTATATNLTAGNYTVTVSDSNGCTKNAPVTIAQPPAPLAATTGSITNISCNGGTNGAATVNATGGTAPYSYSWNTTPVVSTASITNRPTGTYTATITDSKGCTTNSSVSLTEPAILALTGSSTSVSCFGGSNGTATVNVTGGTAPYTYSWNTTPVKTTATATNLSAGSYTVTVTDSKGCTQSTTVTVAQPTSPVAATIGSVNNISCNGGSNGAATVNANGGTAPYTYSWNTTPAITTATLSNHTAGTYVVTVKDTNGCTTSASVTLTQPTVLTVSGSTIPVSCFGGTSTASVNASGGTLPYTYNWNTSPAQTTATASNLPAGSYTVTVNDGNGCMQNTTLTITQPSAPLSATIGSVNNISCNGGSNGAAIVNASGGTAPYTYSWNTTPVITSATLTNRPIGTYAATVTDNKGCTANASVTLTEPTALTIAASTTSVNCYGGTNGTATVNASGGTIPYTYSWNTTPAQTTQTATSLPSGSYTVTVTDGNGCTKNTTANVTQPTTPLTSTIGGVNNISCNGGSNGSATINANGGTAPYTYSWNTAPVITSATLNNRPAGTYSAIVTDSKGCIANNSVTLTEPTILTASGSTTSVSCNSGSNGSATVSANGGTAPYSYTWNTTPAQTTATATNLAAGTYTVTVNDNKGCNQNVTVTVGQPSAPVSATIGNVNNISCFGGSNGSAIVSASGGTAPYTYNWNTTPAITAATLTNRPIGTYTATVTDNKGCTALANVTLTQPTALAASSSTTPVSCFGGTDGTATINMNGGTTPYTFSWNTTPSQTAATATNLSAGSYTVTVTDSNGCTQNTTITVAQPLAPLAATIGSINNISCNGGANGAATVNATGGTSPYTYSWNTTPAQTTTTLTNRPAGTYTATVTDSKGCIANNSVTLTEPTVLTASGSTTSVSCISGSNGSATVNANGGTAPYSYNWNTTPAQTTQTATNLSAGTYTVTVSDNKGCNQNVTITVGQPSAPVSATIGNINNISCFGGSDGSAIVSASGGTAPYTYNWNTTPAINSTSITNRPAGSYSVTVTDSKGCTALANVSLTQPTALAASSSTTPVSCFGGTNGTATINMNGGTAPYTYSWNTTPSQTTATATNLSAGSYTVTITDSNGCTQNTTVAVSQPTAPLSATIGSINNISCNGGTNGSATVNASGGTSPYTYSWNATPVQTTVTLTNRPAGTYTATVTDNKGCTTNATVTLNQPPAITASINPPLPLKCHNDNNGTATVVVNGGVGNYTYSWNTTPVQTSATAANLTAGTYTVTATDNNGCTITASTAITQPATSVTASISNINHLLCFGDTNGSISIAASGGTAPYTYSWNTTPTQTTTTASGLSAGSYSVTVKDSNGCMQSLSALVKQPTKLVAVTSNQMTCPGFSNGAAGVNASGGTAPYTYSWNTQPAQTATQLQNLPAGKYVVTITDSNNCLRKDTVVVNNFNAPNINLTIDTIMCKGDSVRLHASGVSSYVWNPAAILSCNTCPDPLAFPNVDTYFTVIGTDGNGCKDTANVQVKVAAFGGHATSEGKELCEGTSIQLNASGGQHYVWSPAAGLDDPYSSHPVANPDSSTTYRVIIYGDLCYRDTLYVPVKVDPLPTVNLGPDIMGKTAGSAIQLHAAVTNTKRIDWTPLDGLSCNDCYDPTANVTDARTYIATVTSPEGCTAVDTINIYGTCDGSALFIPNTFTPNGDGQNDVFKPYGNGINLVKRFVVFDRWGEKIYEKDNFQLTDAQYGWDGTYKNEIQKPDVYVYYIEAVCINGNSVFIKGDISLVR